MPNNGCLRVLDSNLGDEITYSRQSGYLLKAVPLSDPDLIIPNSDYKTKLPFLSEPKHTWCYYYTKAELARQQKEWEVVVDLYNEAKALHYQPSDPLESLVFIEAQGMTGHIEEARELSFVTYRLDEKTRKGLCEVWKRLQTQSVAVPAGFTMETQIDEILRDLRCVR
jgi:hypothetical protein